MQSRLGRTNYVTPTNYLELVKGYCKLLKEKRATVGDQALKLRNGLTKLWEQCVMNDARPLCRLAARARR